MNSKRWFLFVFSVLLLTVISAPVEGNQIQLSAQEQKVIDYLVKDWGDDYSVTTVDIAIKQSKSISLTNRAFASAAISRRIPNYMKSLDDGDG